MLIFLVWTATLRGAFRNDTRKNCITETLVHVNINSASCRSKLFSNLIPNLQRCACRNSYMHVYFMKMRDSGEGPADAGVRRRSFLSFFTFDHRALIARARAIFTCSVAACYYYVHVAPEQ